MRRSVGTRFREVRLNIRGLLWNGCSADEKNGRQYLFRCAAALAAGFITASAICLFVEFRLTERMAVLRLSLAENISVRPLSPTRSAVLDPYGKFSAANPLGALIPDDTRGGRGEKIRPLKDMSLAGTLPGIGAWIRDPSSARFVLRGKSINGYCLEDVEYSKALLRKDGETHTLYMAIANGNLTPPRKGQTTAGTKKDTTPPKPSQKPTHPGIEPAKDGVEGVVPRELVDKLLMDPYDELAKMRMVPAENGGMQLVRIDSDSVLGQVGVQKDDVIKAVNGVEIASLGDATNAVNSMMSGTRFDVKVERSGQTLELRYQVK